MKKKAFGVLFSFLVAVLSLCVCLQKNGMSVNAASVENSKQAYFLIDNDTPYESNMAVGSASGYNEYLLGETNIEPISAEANQGLYIVGWRVVFSEVDASSSVERKIGEMVIANNQSVFEKNSFSVTYQTETGNFDVDYTISYEDLDGDGKAEKSTIIASQIVENVVIDPVFDFIYSNIEITEFVPLLDLESYNRLTLTATTELLYKNSTTLADSTQYSNSIILDDGKYYYFGDVYTDDNSNFYTLNTRMPKVDDGKNTQKIDVNVGRFRLNETAAFDLDINVGTGLTDGNNIDLQSVSVNYIDLEGEQTEEFLSLDGEKTYVQTKDALKRTTSVAFDFGMFGSQNLVISLKPNYHKLFVATIVPQISNQPAEENKNFIFDALNIPANNYYSKIDEENYFVKDPLTTGILGFKITANDIVQNLGYNYYQFESLSATIDAVTITKNNLNITGSVNQNFEIVVNYVPILYKVDFKFALYDEANNLISPITGQFNVEKSIYLERGATSELIEKTSLSNNVGYTFVGFVNEENTTNLSVNAGVIVGQNTTISIDSVRPSNKTIYILFVETEYTLRMNNLNNINLNDGLNTIYPISAMNLSISRADNLITSSLQGLKSAMVQSSFDKTIKLGDTITVLAKVNTGFKILGFGFEQTTKLYDGTSFTFEITQTFLQQYDQSNTIMIDMFDFEDFEVYSFTYTLNGAPNADGTNTLMADLSIEYNGTVYTKTNTTENVKYIETGSDKAQFVLTGVHLYDRIKLISTAKNYIGDDGTEIYYLFTKFAENSVIFPLVSTTDVNSRAMIYTVLKEGAEVTVFYTMPGLRLSISVDNANAFNLVESITQGTTYLLDLDANTQITFDASTLLATQELSPSKTYKLYIGNNFAFGYELKGYEFNSAENLSSNTNFEFTTSTSTQLHTIQILTNITQYKLTLNHTKSITEDPFDTTTKIITVSNLTIEFDTLKGYYVSQVYFKNLIGSYQYTKAQCDNSYTESSYSYSFTADELSELIVNYSTIQDGVTSLDMWFVYTLHTYEITVKYGFVNSKGIYDQRVSYPKISATADGEKIYYRDLGESIVFFDIPYGTDIVLTADSVFEEGISPYGWDGYNKQPGFSSNRTQLFIEKEKLTSNQTVQYKLNYNSYTIKIERFNNSQDPIVQIKSPIDGSLADKISRFDRLSINMNADRQNGWRFVTMYYYKTTYQIYDYDEETFASTALYYIDGSRYVLNTEPYNDTITYYTKQNVRVDYSAFAEYTYSETDWQQNYLSVYVLDGSEYRHNTSSTYDPSKQYYVYKNTSYEDNEFNIVNYLAQVDANGVYSITFYCVYDYIDITFDVKAGLIGYSKIYYDNAQTEVQPIDFAKISFSKISNANIEASIAEGESVSINDYSIKIKINLNTINLDGNTISLAAGVALKQAFVCDASLGQLTIIDNGNGVYVLEFKIATMLENDCISLNDSFIVYLNYQVQNKNMVLTTSVPAEDFYMSKSGETIFSMGVSESAYGFGPNSSSSNGSTKISLIGNDSIAFLSKVLVTYMFVPPYATNYNQYFKISGLTLYNLNSTTDVFGFTTFTKGDVIKAVSTDELSRYGITELSFENQKFDFRFVNDLYIELTVEPIITVNAENNSFSVYFDCDNSGNGKEQTLTVGQTSASNIEMAKALQDYVVITYHKNIIQNGVNAGYSTESTTPIDAGTYLVKIGFAGLGDWAWLSTLTYGKPVYFIILPKEIDIMIQAEKPKFEKEYEGKNAYNFANIDTLLNYIYLSDGSKTYPYSEANSNLSFDMSKLLARISYTNNNTQVYSGIATKTGEMHNIHLTGLAILNNNFKLRTDNLLFENVIKINKKEITLDGVKVYDKVDDGTDTAEYQLDAQLRWLGVLPNDLVESPNPENLSLRFAKDANGKVKVGYNVNIVIDASRVLKGEDSDNYTIKVNGTTANIYPYSISTEVEGFGKIEVRNDKGLINLIHGTKHELAGLIPIGAELKVELVRVDTPEYVSLYPNISRFLNRNRNYAIGYKITFTNNNITTNLSNKLTLVLPTVARLTNALMLNANSSIQLEYEVDNDSLVVDLSQTNYEPYTFVLVQQRVLLKPWQLILIISLAVLLLAIVIIVFIVVRKRKKARYSLNEKI